MAAILLLGALAALVWMFHRRVETWREAGLAAGVTFGVLICLITEALSAVRMIQVVPLAACWILVIVAALVAGWRLGLGQRNGEPLRTGREPLPALWRWSVAGLVLIVAMTLFLAVVGGPNLGDALIYHLPRVLHWAQDRSVAHYPTQILLQLYQPPWAEFLILHLYILSHSDRLFNLPQWSSMIGALIGVSLVARELGLGKRGQLLAVVFCATLPQGILSSSTTQNDYIPAFWLVAAVFYIFKLRRTDCNIWGAALGMGASLGLGLLTKGTMYVIGFPFGLWGAAAGLRRAGMRGIAPLGAAAVLLVSLNAPHWYRNVHLFGDPLEPAQERTLYVTDHPTLGTMAANVVRGIASHLGTPSRKINAAMANAITTGLEKLGLKNKLPGATFNGGEFTLFRTSTSPGRAGDPLQVVTLWLVMAVFLAGRYWRPEADHGRRRRAPLGVYLLCLVGGFLLFCYTIRWQQWGARLHHPLLAASAPFVAAVAIRSLGHRQKLLGWLSLILIIASLPWVFCNMNHPLMGPYNIFTTPELQQWEMEPRQLKLYRAAARIARQRQAKNIGFDNPGCVCEFMLWRALDEEGCGKVRVEHYNVTNVSSRLSDLPWFGDFRPDLIVYQHPDCQDAEEKLRGFKAEWTGEEGGVYVPSPSTRP